MLFGSSWENLGNAKKNNDAMESKTSPDQSETHSMTCEWHPIHGELSVNAILSSRFGLLHSKR
jgi:hypothetical protein